MNLEDTRKLIEELSGCDIEIYLNKYDCEFDYIDIGKYLNYLIENNSLSKSEIILRSDINKFYAYQILNGMKKPVRNKVLPFAFALGLDLDETQKMLKCCNYAILSPKRKRDSIIIFSLINELSLMQANELLYYYQLELLG